MTINSIHPINPYSWLARAPHVTLHIARLPEGQSGRWIPERNTIVLDDRLNQAERRCTLTHELMHMMNADDPHLPQWLLERQERSCRERAARLLIPIRRYAEALLWAWPGMYEEMAEELWVDIPTLKDFIGSLTPDEVEYVAERVIEAHRDVA